jgi:hypothetical protein
LSVRVEHPGEDAEPKPSWNAEVHATAKLPSGNAYTAG